MDTAPALTQVSNTCEESLGEENQLLSWCAQLGFSELVNAIMYVVFSKTKRTENNVFSTFCET